MAKSHVPENEKRDVIITCIVRDGSNTAIAKELPGKYITMLEDLLEIIMNY